MALPVLYSNGRLQTDGGDAIPASALPGVVASTTVLAVVALDNAAYAALSTKSATTLYFITDDPKAIALGTNLLAGEFPP
jgi:phosphoribosylcarboxyaminoimidazole (NCAIR) mutase